VNNGKVKLKVLGVTYSQVQAGAYALILGEENGARRVPIIIGTPEAQSIGIYLEGLHPPRPLTHDLFVSFIESMQITLKEVFIYKHEDEVFYAELLFEDEKRKVRVDARTSDAIALAVRTHSDIYISEEIMKEVAVEMEENDILEEMENEKDKSVGSSLETMNIGELQKALDEAITMENYEKASYIRDLINRKTNRL
jgi:bifunctional DNase/RNase